MGLTAAGDGAASSAAGAGTSSQGSAQRGVEGGVEAPASVEGRWTSRIELINFAASSRLQSLPTAHASPLIHVRLFYSSNT